MSLQNHVRVLLCVVFMGVLVGYMLNVKKDMTDNIYIDKVKEGYLVDFADVKVRDAFNYAFTEPYWRYYQAQTGQHVVELSGNISFLAKKGHVILLFIVNGEANEFQLLAMKFNDVILDTKQRGMLIHFVYETWHMKHLTYQ